MSNSPRTHSPRPGNSSPRQPAISIAPPPPPLPAAAATPGASTTNALTLLLQQALAKGDLSKSLESMSSLLSLSGDNRLKADLLLKLIDLTRHFQSLIVAAPLHTAPLLKCLRLLLIDKEPTLRSQSLRVLRYLLTDWEMVTQMLLVNLDLMIVRSLERESKFLWERMQALKFIRKWMAMLATAQARIRDPLSTPPLAKGLPNRPPIGLTRSLVQSLVSIAEQPKDDFRRVCLDAIRELTLLSPAIVASCNGIRTLVDSILDPACVDIANSLTLTLLYLIDSETTRGFLRPSVDLVRLISVFTDTTAADNPERENRRAAAHKALVMLMRSWTGILVLTSDPQCLRALIGMLNLPASIKGSSWARETIFDLLFEIVHVVKAQDVRETAQRIRHSMAAASGGVTHAYPPNLLHSYMVMLLLSFLACDLVDILTQLALSQDAEFASVASKLLGEILGLSAELLPREVTKKLNSMRGVIASAAAFDSNEENATSGGGGASSFVGGSSAASAQQSNADKSDEAAAISHRHRAVHVLSSLAHSELHALGPLALAGYGSGNASAATHAAPGTGWAWTGALGVQWEAVHALQREQARLDASGAAGGRRDSHEWNTIESRGASSLVRNTSFSRSGGMSGGGGGSGQDSFVEHTPTGRRAVLHGIRLERLALRCDLAVHPARLLSSGAYGASNAGTAEAALAPATCLSSSSALASRNRMLHRLAISARSSAAISSHGGNHVPTSALLTYQVSDFHTEENDLAPLLKKSQVLSTKEFRAWEWEYIHLIIEKFMSTSPTHTAYLVLKTKFPKRLLSFLRSDKKHFVELDWQVFHLRFVRMGVSLLKAMLGCQEGREYSWFIEFIDSLFLSLLWEISSTDGRKDTQTMGGTGVEKLEGVGSSGSAGGGARPSTAPATTASVESSAFTSGRRLSHLSSGLAKSKAKIFQAMSRPSVQSRLIREYFTFLSILSSSAHGVAYFEKYGFFDCIAHLARDPSKDYLTKLFLSSVNIVQGPMAAGVAGSGRSVVGGWRRIIEGWLAVPPPGSAASGQPGKEGCNVYLRLHAVGVFLIAFRRHQSSQGSQSAAQETDLHGCGVLGSHPTSSVSAIVSGAALSNPSSVQSAQGDAMGATEWMLGILLQQLQCLDHHLRSAVLHALEEICLVSPTALHALIARRPVILKDLARQTRGNAVGASGTGGASSLLYPVAHRLLVLFLSSRSGLEFLRSSFTGGLGLAAQQPTSQTESWLDQQLAQWKHVAGSSESSEGGCTTYVRGLEEALVSALSATNRDEPSEHGEEGLTTAAGSAAAAQQAQAGASKLDELSAPPAPPSSVSSAWSGPPLRSALDEHVSAVIHNLPWVVDLTVEHPQGRTVQVMTECWVVTTAHAPVSSTPSASAEPSSKASSATAPPHMTRALSSSEDLGQAFSAASTTSASADAMAHALAPMTYLVCQTLDLEGFPRPVKLESNVTLRARISIGAGVHSLNVQDMFSHPTGQNTPATPSAAESRQGGRSVHGNYRGGGHGGNDRNGGDSHSSGFRGLVDTATTFQEEREIERDWSRTFFPDHSGHASEYVCRPRDREKIHPEQPWLASVNASELCEEDEARWHFEVPDSSLPAPYTHSSVRGPTVGSSPAGATTLESIWFPLPLLPASPPSVVLLPHFYGELARTDEGVRVLSSTGQIREMERSIREGGLSGCENDVGLQAGKQPSATAAEVAGFMNIPSAASALEKRAALWAVGHIGSTAPGFQLLNQQAPGLVQYISQQSVSCTTLSMRGTCFYILGLLGRSSLGRTYLSGLGWSFSPFPGACIALPSVVSLGGTTDAWTRGEMGETAGGEEGREEEIARRLAEELEDDDDDSLPSTGARMQIIPASTTSSLRTSSPLSGFLRLDWPSSAYRGSWAMDPANIFGINSSKRTRKVGGVDGPAQSEGAEKAQAVSTAAQKDDANEVLSSTEGIEVILSHLSNLCNHVTQKNSLQALRTMKAQPHHAHFFTSPLLLFETYKLLQTYNYKLPARRFLFFDLFGSVSFNMSTIAIFDSPFNANPFGRQQAEKQKAAKEGATATGALTPR